MILLTSRNYSRYTLPPNIIENFAISEKPGSFTGAGSRFLERILLSPGPITPLVKLCAAPYR